MNLAQNQENEKTKNSNRQRFSIELDIQSLKRMSEPEKHRQIAMQSAEYAKSLFWIIGRLAAAATNGNRNFTKIELTTNLAQISEIGVACCQTASDSPAAITTEGKDFSKNEQ